MSVYRCIVYEKTLASEGFLKSHIYGVHAGKKYKNMSGTFNNPDRLKKHINTLHDDQTDFRDDHSEIVNANNSEISTNKLNNFGLTSDATIRSDDHNPITESDNLLHPMFKENEIIHKDTTIVKSERHTLDNQIFICPVCKSEGIFSSLQKAQQHISEFHQLPFDIVPQTRTLF